MTARDAFSLSPAEWDRVEEIYSKVAGRPAEDMLAELLAGASSDQQRFLALGIMVGRASR
jgi:phage-related baseplate assembly protein